MRIVIDTNVFVAALRSNQGASFRVLEYIRANRIQPVFSVALFLEYEAVLKRPGMVPLPLPLIDRFLDLLALHGEEQRIYFVWRPTLSDPADDMVLETAVAAGCSTIATFKVRHFDGSPRFGVSALTPQLLLHDLGN